MKGALGQASEEQCTLAVQLTSLSLLTQSVTAAEVALVGLEIQKSSPVNVTLCYEPLLRLWNPPLAAGRPLRSCVPLSSDCSVSVWEEVRHSGRS